MAARTAHILEHLDVRLSHFDEGPAGNICSASCLSSDTLFLIIKDVVNLLLGELRRRVLLIEMLSAQSGPRRLGTLQKHVVPVDGRKEWMPLDLKSALWSSTETLGRVPIQKRHH